MVEKVLQNDDIDNFRLLYTKENVDTACVQLLGDKQGSFLHIAVECDAVNCCKFILQCQSDSTDSGLVKRQNSEGETPLHVAVMRRLSDASTNIALNTQVIETLLRYDVEKQTSVKCKLGLTALELSLFDMDLYCFMQDQLIAAEMKKPKFNEYTILKDLSLGLEPFPVPVLNYTSTSVDLECIIPPQFYYVKHVISGSDKIASSAVSETDDGSCSCTDGCIAKCPCLLKGNICFESVDRIKVPDDDRDDEKVSLLVECGDLCLCGTLCRNNVTQTDCKYPVEINYVSQSLGFSLRSAGFIPKGAFLAHYAGRLVDKNFSQTIEDDSYLFAIPGNSDAEEEVGEDKNSDDCFMIDATNFGNFSRFINHSCNPNLVAIEVKSTSSDQEMNVSKLSFFTKCDVESEFQLTFDYGEEFWDVKRDVFRCKCGYSQCKYA